VLTSQCSVSVSRGMDISAQNNFLPGQFPRTRTIPPYRTELNLKIAYIQTCMHCIHLSICEIYIVPLQGNYSEALHIQYMHHACIHRCIHIYPISTHTHTQAYIYTYIHTYIYIYTYIHTYMIYSIHQRSSIIFSRWPKA